MGNARVTLELTKAEALVFFEWLARIDASGALPVEDDAERKVLWELEAQLEKLLTEPLAPDYKQRLAAAREEVRGTASE
jgi:hypothetical protein